MRSVRGPESHESRSSFYLVDDVRYRSGADRKLNLLTLILKV